MESKHDKFKRVASKRVNEILAKVDTLGNCANKNTYDYTDEDVRKVFKAIDTKLKEVKSTFKTTKDNSFKL